MTWAITIGAYRLCDFVALNLAQCRKLFGADTMLLVSDDLSHFGPQMSAIAERYEAGYMAPQARRSHFSGDFQALINAVVFAAATQSDAALKLSQRFVPCDGLKALLEETFSNPSVQIVLPGRPGTSQMARPSASFYSQFGILTDCIAIRRGAIPPDELVDVYRARHRSEERGARLVETTLGWIIANRFRPENVAVLDQLANHSPLNPRKLFLRKSQSNRGEYIRLAEEHGIKGVFDLREWGLIEGPHYMAAPLIA